MNLRWDKFIWCVRLTKTRSQASELIQKGRIQINHQSIKPSRETKVGDIISFHKNNAEFSYKVLALLDKRVGAKLVPDYIEDLTKEEEIQKYKAYQIAQNAYKHYGTGKPSKKDRRDLDTYLDNWE